MQGTAKNAAVTTVYRVSKNSARYAANASRICQTQACACLFGVLFASIRASCAPWGEIPIQNIILAHFCKIGNVSRRILSRAGEACLPFTKRCGRHHAGKSGQCGTPLQAAPSRKTHSTPRIGCPSNFTNPPLPLPSASSLKICRRMHAKRRPAGRLLVHRLLLEIGERDRVLPAHVVIMRQDELI